MQIYDMKVNHLTNPLGFRMVRTVFSWKVRKAEGKKQEAARLQIAADEGMGEILFDSGFDAAADSLGYPVTLALKPYTRYYWTVTVRSDAGEEAAGKSSGLRRPSCRRPGLADGSPATAVRRDILILRRM